MLRIIRTRMFHYRLAGVLVGILVALISGGFNVSNSPSALACCSYNRSAAASYADTWAHSFNPNYHDYSNLGGGADCTNFASQVMRAGTLPELAGCCGQDPNDIYEWWHTNPTAYTPNSKSWSAADWMNRHMSQYQGSRYQAYSSVNNLQNGDVLLLQWPGYSVPSHARVIVDRNYNQEYVPAKEGGTVLTLGVWGILADQHTTARKRVIWDDGIPAGTLEWYWSIVW